MAEQIRRKILLIDDDTSLLVTLRDFLEFEGYEVVTADSGEKGLEKLATIKPDLIVLDMSMPGMSGVGFLKAISDAEGKPSHPVLVLTARANMAEFFANVDVDGFVAKPCDPSDLLMEISRIIFLRRGTEAAEVKPGTEKRKLLLGEDDEGEREVLVRAFGEAGYLVDFVQSGPEVLEKAIVERPDAIVVKHVLSNMNGDAVARMLREMPKTRDIPVILYTDESNGAAGWSMDPATGVKEFIRSNDAQSLIAAVRRTLAVAS